MPTGLNIRDFTKVYREVRYESEGAIRLSEIEHNAYLNRLTLEVTHYDAYRSTNFKTNPESTHWGYVTQFKGSSVLSSTPIKFVKQRVFECINQGIWAYHQATETVRLEKSFAESAASAILQSDLLEETQQTVVDFYLNLISNLPGQIEEDLQWILSFTYRGGPEPEPDNQAYTAFPLTSPFPDVFKFKSDVPVSFLFRLESWYLVPPAVYIVANPTDTSDETEGEDEYPEPEGKDEQGDGPVFPNPSPADPQNDPRDGGAAEEEEYEPGTTYEWSGAFSGTLLGGGGTPESYEAAVTFQAAGSQFPFTAKATESVLIVRPGETFYSGLEVIDRFGQLVGTFYQGTGFRAGAHTINVTASPLM